MASLGNKYKYHVISKMTALLQAKEQGGPIKTGEKIHRFVTSKFFTIEYNTEL